MSNRVKVILKKISNIKKRIERRDVIIFTISVTILSTALLALWPGLYTSDSYDQYNQAQTERVHAAHPAFHTFTIWLINILHDSRAMLPLLHVFLFSLMWAVMCKYVRRLYGNTKKVFYIQIAFIAVLCMLPVIYTYTVSAWKDVLYSYSLISIAFLLFLGGNKKFNYSKLEVVFMALLLALTVAYRHNGIVPAFVVLTTLLVGMFKYRVAIKKIAALVGFSAAFYAVTVFAPGLFLRVQASETNVKTGVSIFYMAGLMNSGVEIDEEDKQVLYKLMPEQYWFSDYYRYSYVPIDFGGKLDRKAARSSGDQLFDMALKYGLKHPDIIAGKFFEVNNMVWNVYWPVVGPYKTTPGINAMPLSKDSLAADAKASKLELLNDEMRLGIAYTLDSTIMQTLMYRPALYMYLSIAIVAVMSLRDKAKRYWLLLVPMLGNLPAILAFSLTQDMRFLYINVLTFFVVLLVFLAWMHGSKKPRVLV